MTAAATATGTVASTDGTTIAFERAGEGPPVVLVDPAGGYTGFDNIRGLGRRLAGSLTVLTYDRRGRGGSGDTPPYAIDREIDDLAAVIAAAGRPAAVYGFSSGALLAVHAAARGVAIERLVLLEPPVDTDGQAPEEDLGAEIERLVAADRRGDAVQRWLTAIGVPDAMIAEMAPVRPALEAVAHTLAYDVRVAEATTRELLASVATPTLVLHSEGSSPDLVEAARVVADTMPGATRRGVPGEWHGVSDEVLAPIVAGFLVRA